MGPVQNRDIRQIQPLRPELRDVAVTIGHPAITHR
jgi:hypothetical protein